MQSKTFYLKHTVLNEVESRDMLLHKISFFPLNNCITSCQVTVILFFFGVVVYVTLALAVVYCFMIILVLDDKRQIVLSRLN